MSRHLAGGQRPKPFWLARDVQDYRTLCLHYMSRHCAGGQHWMCRIFWYESVCRQALCRRTAEQERLSRTSCSELCAQRVRFGTFPAPQPYG